ncbi:hypothetical protein ACFWAN_32655 [Streptomyces mirabilis]|uniref:hypothetical protein n=1 Tax=Streptomyces mirabilis TaxID=68239 RepID=UPI00365B388E
MAEAKRTTVEHETKRVEKVPGIILTLTHDEAETLLAVGAKIGGDKVGTPREHFESIISALRNSGARDFTANNHPFQNIQPGSYLNFRTRKEPYRWGITF